MCWWAYSRIPWVNSGFLLNLTQGRLLDSRIRWARSNISLGWFIQGSFLLAWASVIHIYTYRYTYVLYVETETHLRAQGLSGRDSSSWAGVLGCLGAGVLGCWGPSILAYNALAPNRSHLQQWGLPIS